ncbi:hypothetical protein CRYUN_Cryun12cG0041300 [Craigia yunnanensis]
MTLSVDKFLGMALSVELHPWILFWKFFPDVYRKESSIKPSDEQYCKFDNQKLTFFTSSLYLAALVSSLVASKATRLFGRRKTMMVGGLLFAVGALLNGFSKNLLKLYIGRALPGFGVECANQAPAIIYP